MNLIKNIFAKVRILSKKKKVLIVFILLLGLYFSWMIFFPSSKQVQYQTAKAQKGTLIISVTSAGQVSVANKVSIVTQASGIVSNIYVKSGQQVNAGDKIADITLDTAGQQRQAQALSSLLSAQNSLNSANAQTYTLQSALFIANQKFVNDKGIQNPTDQNKQDPVYIEENASWLAAEAAYKNQSGIISQAQANLSNASLAYQLTSGTITAPTAGVVSDLTITKGMQIGSSNTTAGSSTNTSNQGVASIKTGNSTTVTVDVAEVDASKIKVGQNATISLDAITDKTFTGKVMGINTTGTVSSGVTTYTAVIQLDDVSNKDIFPNMSVSANIITKIEDSVLLIPSAAVQTVNGQSLVQVLKNNKVTQVSVSVGDSSDTQTVITSGLSDGDVVITSAITSSTTSNSTTSPFGGGLRIGGFGGGLGGGGTGRTGGATTRSTRN